MFFANVGDRDLVEEMLSVLIDTNLLLAARDHRAERFFYASSACVYAADKQTSPDVRPLKECDAYPAMPEDGYGWEKLFSERMCRHFREDFKVPTRVYRFHNVYGPLGTYDGGREKAPAAICRKVALARDGEAIEVWGDGRQSRSFLYVDDCVEGIYRIVQSDHPKPLNLGSDERVTIDELVDLVARIAGKTVGKRHRLDAPQGVRGRNSDNSRLGRVLGWLPRTSLQDGLAPTYSWIEAELRKEGRVPATAEMEEAGAW